MPAGVELALVVASGIDTVHHRGIGGKNAMRGIVLLCFAEIADGKIGQKIGKRALCLRDKGSPIGEEKDIFHPPVAKKNVHKRDGGARFARPVAMTRSALRRFFSSMLWQTALIACS